MVAELRLIIETTRMQMPDASASRCRSSMRGNVRSRTSRQGSCRGGSSQLETLPMHHSLYSVRPGYLRRRTYGDDPGRRDARRMVR